MSRFDENPLALDLGGVVQRAEADLKALAGARLFVTGGTGFFGRWVLESIAAANHHLGTRINATILTRNPAAFRQKAPMLCEFKCFELLQGDIRTFLFPRGLYSDVIHLATPASAIINAEAPLDMLDTIVEGTRRVLKFAVAAGARRILLASSGAVYGSQPPGISHMPEDCLLAPDTLDAGHAYHEGKRVAELMCTLYAAKHGLEAKIARGFAFVGPHLPLDRHFAIGNFIRDAIQGGPIRVNGDGTPLRSYLYAADLVVWLLAILVRGRSCVAYNVGAEDAVSIADLARRVAGAVDPAPDVLIAGEVTPGGSAGRYVPSVRRAREELGLGVTIGLDEAIRRTLAFVRATIR